MGKVAVKAKIFAKSAKELLKRKISPSGQTWQHLTDPRTSKGALGPKLGKKELEALRRRDELIAEYMPYALSIASRVYQNLSSAVEFDEVLCNARVGLLEAAKRFDEAHGVDFRTFAYYRIKGAIYDGLRKAGWIPRTLYAKIKFEEAANDYLQFMSTYADSRDSDDSDTEVTETVNSLASIYVMSLDSSEDFDVEDPDTPNFEQSAEFRQVRLRMREAIDSLPSTEKRLIKMYYFQNRTLEEIGERLGLSKSWASRLHAKALSMLLKKIKQKKLQKGELEISGEGHE